MDDLEVRCPELYAGTEGDRRLRRDADDMCRSLCNFGNFLKGALVYAIGGFLTSTTIIPAVYEVAIGHSHINYATHNTSVEIARPQFLSAAEESFMPRETSLPTEGNLVLKYLTTSPATLPKETRTTEDKTGKPIDN
jgi:hypothetical protein